ncbi:hypothetical protein [Aliarcobacter butzleri]|uniref:hypothetical protein n=1 Tax=Aliarcobacter butzleri TaxID=28197 RepID=UPI002B24A13D|nr:hypothetical protein [Aliarcobacter butzleri]
MLFALDAQYFIGTNLKKTQAKIEHNIEVYTPFGTVNESLEQTIKDSALELKIGTILNNTYRIYLSGVEYKTNLFKVKMINGNYEYLIPITNDFRLFSGVHMGTFKNNMVYGVQGGFIYDITKNIEFEAGGFYSRYKKEVKVKGEKFGFEFTDNIKIENSKSLFAGFNYKF